MQSSTPHRKATRYAGKKPIEAPDFSELPEDAFVRIPAVCALYAISANSVWRWVKLGLIPKPHKIGPQATAWNVGELRRSLAAKKEAA